MEMPDDKKRDIQIDHDINSSKDNEEHIEAYESGDYEEHCNVKGENN